MMLAKTIPSLFFPGIVQWAAGKRLEAAQWAVASVFLCFVTLLGASMPGKFGSAVTFSGLVTGGFVALICLIRGVRLVWRGVELKWGSAVVFALVLVSVEVGVVFTAHEFLFGSAHVTSPAMQPTLLPGDRFFFQRGVDAVSLKRGMLVYVAGPEGKNGEVRRVIALSGDEVSLDPSGRVFLNKTILPYRKDTPTILQETSDAGSYTVRISDDKNVKTATIQVPAESVFVLNDLRVERGDSKEGRFTPLSDITGIPTYIWSSKDLSDHLPRWSRVGKTLQPE